MTAGRIAGRGRTRSVDTDEPGPGNPITRNSPGVRGSTLPLDPRDRDRPGSRNLHCRAPPPDPRGVEPGRTPREAGRIPPYGGLLHSAARRRARFPPPRRGSRSACAIRTCRRRHRPCRRNREGAARTSGRTPCRRRPRPPHGSRPEGVPIGGWRPLASPAASLRWWPKAAPGFPPLPACRSRDRRTLAGRRESRSPCERTGSRKCDGPAWPNTSNRSGPVPRSGRALSFPISTRTGRTSGNSIPPKPRWRSGSRDRDWPPDRHGGCAAR